MKLHLDGWKKQTNFFEYFLPNLTWHICGWTKYTQASLEWVWAVFDHHYQED